MGNKVILAEAVQRQREIHQRLLQEMDNTLKREAQWRRAFEVLDCDEPLTDLTIAQLDEMRNASNRRLDELYQGDFAI